MSFPTLPPFPIPGPELEAVLRVAPVKSYLLSKGWVQRPWDNPYGLWFERQAPDRRNPAVITLPAVETVVDYPLRLEEVMRTLQMVEGRPAREILKDILAQPVDTPPAPPYAGEPSPSPTAP
jgi:hypothetical protein